MPMNRKIQLYGTSSRSTLAILGLSLTYFPAYFVPTRKNFGVQREDEPYFTYREELLYLDRYATA